MLDWNHDGKIDYKDHAFYNNVVEPGMKKDEKSLSSDGQKHSSGSSPAESSGKGWVIFIGICIVYLFIKLIGG